MRRHQTMIFLYQTYHTLKNHLRVHLNMLKIELITCVPNRPSNSWPFFQLSSVELLVHHLEKKEEIFSMVTKLLCCPLKERPNITRERAFPQNMGDPLRGLAANFTHSLHWNSFPLKIFTGRQAMRARTPYEISNFWGNIELPNLPPTIAMTLHRWMLRMIWMLKVQSHLVGRLNRESPGSILIPKQAVAQKYQRAFLDPTGESAHQLNHTHVDSVEVRSWIRGLVQPYMCRYSNCAPISNLPLWPRLNKVPCSQQGPPNKRTSTA